MGIFDKIIKRISGRTQPTGGETTDDFISPIPRSEEIKRRTESGGIASPLPDEPLEQPDEQLTPEDIAVKEAKPAGFPEAEQVALAVKDFYSKQVPEGADIQEYFPIAEYLDDMVYEAEKKRPGAGALMALQGFYESTGGRATKNLFGVKPGGKTKQFSNLEDAIDYQLSPSVLASPRNKNMNVLDEDKDEPLTVDRIRRLYDSYDPPGAYLDSLLDAFESIRDFKSKKK